MAWAPLRYPTFRMLWGTWLTANLCMWMNDVAAAWLMTSLTTAPVMVALVQSASTLPVFLLGVPSGALADILDRRRYLIGTQFWIATVAVVLCLTKFTGTLNAPLLLVLTFANGIGLAMRWPVYAALVPSLVPRAGAGLRDRTERCRHEHLPRARPRDRRRGDRGAGQRVRVPAERRDCDRRRPGAAALEATSSR